MIWAATLRWHNPRKKLLFFEMRSADGAWEEWVVDRRRVKNWKRLFTKYAVCWFDDQTGSWGVAHAYRFTGPDLRRAKQKAKEMAEFFRTEGFYTIHSELQVTEPFEIMETPEGEVVFLAASRLREASVAHGADEPSPSPQSSPS